GDDVGSGSQVTNQVAAAERVFQKPDRKGGCLASSRGLDQRGTLAYGRVSESTFRRSKMKKSSYKHRVPTALLVILISGTGILPLRLAAAQDYERTLGSSIDRAAVARLPMQNDPSGSLARGRQLLKQGHADQALPLLESALSGFTSSSNARGIAAAQDALGDLYMVQGQYKVALDHYQ